MKRIAIAAFLLAAVQTYGVTLAITEKNATTIKSSQSVTLQYSEEEGTYLGYLKATLSRQRAYTLNVQGVTTNMDLSVSIYPKETESDDAKEPQAEFEEVEVAGNDIYQVMYADSWYIDDEDSNESDPKSWTYFFEFSAAIPCTFTVNFVNGVSLPPGIADNPRVITPSASEQTVSDTLQTGNEYFMRARLTAGTLYSFATDGGNEDVPLSLEFTDEESGSDLDSDSDDDDPSYVIYDNPAYAGDEYNEGIYVVVDKTAYYSIVVSGSSSSTNETSTAADSGDDDDLYSFSFKYKRYDSRPIASHNLAGSLEDGVPVTAIAGYECDFAGAGYFDNIIDESLYSVYAAKGERYVAETSGASTNILMRIYDSKGNILCENTSLDGQSDDVRCVFEASSAGTYYVGVCEDIEDIFAETPSFTTATLTLEKVVPQEGSPDSWDLADDTASGAVPLEAGLGNYGADIFEYGAASGVHKLSKTDWYDVFSIAGRKDITYAIGFEFADAEETSYYSLYVDIFTLSGSSEKIVASGDVAPGSSTAAISFTASANATYYVRVSVSETIGLDYPGYMARLMAYSTSGEALGILKVDLFGTSLGSFSIGSESVKYPGGSSVVLPAGSKTVKFTTVSGFGAIAQRTVSVSAGETTAIEEWYSDTSDPKDDTAKGATAWTLKNVSTSFSRTLWQSDSEDNFAITGTDGYYYDFALSDVDGDAVFTITNALLGTVVGKTDSASRVNLPKSSAKYYLTVFHGNETPEGGGYVLSGLFANVGAIKFAKTAVSAKENVSSVAVQVQRTAKDGKVRVRYRTEDGTAKAGEDYVAQSGILEWPSGNNAAKTITVKLIPELVEHYTGNRTFNVVLEPFGEEEVEDGEYVAAITGGDVCTVTMTEVSRLGTTVESVYAAKAPKTATVSTENVALETGTFYGIAHADEGSLTNGLPQIASITFTASTANPAALSAKILIAGKTYSFSGKGWDEDSPEGLKTKTLIQVAKVANVTYTNTLSVAVREGATVSEGDWLKAGAEVELEMNVPDASNKGVQAGVHYTGTLARNNAKIQDYLNAVTNFAGYYTISLVPSDVSAEDGIPYGNGYIAVTVDNKGTAKIAGMLADGANKPSMSVASCAIVEDEESDNGYSMYIPVYFAKSPVLLGGTLRLYKNAEAGAVVAESAGMLVWNNDNAQMRYDGSAGYSISLAPCGGWFDTIINLERYYLDTPLSVSALRAEGFPKELLASGYDYVSGIEADGTPVSVVANVFSTLKRTLVKSGTSYDLSASTNAPNVQVKLARATGLVSGTFSLWSANGSAFKEVTGFKHFGVLVLACEPSAPLADCAATAGFAVQTVKLTYYNETTRRSATRSWIFSVPFDICFEKE